MAVDGSSGVAFDPTGFAGLKLAAQREDPAAVREAAQQFEALLLQTMLKEMRASSQDDLLGSSQMDSYYEMFDQQIALDMARKGGFGLADVLVRQLESAARQRPAEAPEPGTPKETAAPAANAVIARPASAQ